VGGLGAPPAGAVNADHGDRVVSASPAAWTPHVMNGSVNALTQVGSTIIAAGTFTSVSPAGTYADRSDDLTRNRIFAFDATTGAIDERFDPNLGGAASSLATDGTHVYVGGAFGSVAGRTGLKRLVKLDLNGTPVAQFKAVPNAVVNDVVVRGSRVYVGGAFSSVTSRKVAHPRTALAALDATKGTPLAALDLPVTGVYNPSKTSPGTTNVKRFDVTADGSRLAMVGNFAKVGGRTRSQVAVLDTSGATATVTSWATNRFDRAHSACSDSFDTFTRDVDLSPDGSYFVVSTTGAFSGGAASGSLCDTVSRWETAATGNDPTWVAYTGGDTTYGVAVTGSAVYVGGHMRWLNNPFQGDQAGPGAVPRDGIAALDPLNGLPLAWNPGRARGVGAQALLATGQGLWVGSDTTLFNGQRRGRVAFLPLAGGSRVPAAPAAALPNDLYAVQPGSAGSARSRVRTIGGRPVLRGHAAAASLGALQRRSVNGSGVPVGGATTVDTTVDWSRVRGAFLLGGTLYYGLDDGRLYKRAFTAVDGALGAPQAIDLHDDPESGARIPFPIAAVTGMFFDPATHRVYYTLGGDSRLHYRYFTPQGEVVGAQSFVADAGGVGFGTVAGMTLAGGRILYGSADGALRSVPFSGGRVTGSPSVVSADGTWTHRALFVPTG
jgi:hypothetical protein